jgi:hypothetical protein
VVIPAQLIAVVSPITPALYTICEVGAAVVNVNKLDFAPWYRASNTDAGLDLGTRKGRVATSSIV